MLRIFLTATAVDDQGNREAVEIDVPVYSHSRTNDGPVVGTCEIGRFTFQPTGDFEPFRKDD